MEGKLKMYGVVVVVVEKVVVVVVVASVVVVGGRLGSVVFVVAGTLLSHHHPVVVVSVGVDCWRLQDREVKDEHQKAVYPAVVQAVVFAAASS